MLDVETARYIVALVSVGVTVITFSIQFRNYIHTRQASLFMQLYDRFHDTEFWKQYGEIIFLTDWENYDDFWEKYGPKNLQAFSDWMSFGSYFCGIGVLLKRNLIDIGLVEDLIGDYVFWVWQKWETLLAATEKGGRRPQSAEWFEYLYKEISKERERQRRAGIS